MPEPIPQQQGNRPLDKAPWTTTIIGAGPVGLGLAALLLRSGFPSSQLTILEAEPSSLTRATLGGTLDLRPGSGLDLIDKAGLRQRFDTLARPEGEEIRVYDQKLGQIFEHAPFKNESAKNAVGNPEIDRSDLRNLLLDAVTPHVNIKWDHKVSHIDVSTDTDGKQTIHLANGSTHAADLIVGADGAWSKARRALSTAEAPTYTGRSFFEFHISPENPAGDQPRVWAGEGFCQVIGDNSKIILYQKNTARGGLLRAYAVATMDEKELKQGGKFSRETMSDATLAKETLVQYFSEDQGITTHWDQAVLDSIRHSDPESASAAALTARPFYYIHPDKLHWDTQTGLTLCGDAAHLMSPFSGEGVNQGFLDCVSLVDELGKALSADNDSTSSPSEMLSSAQQAYETEMVNRVKKHCIRSQSSLETACPTDPKDKPLAARNIANRLQQITQAWNESRSHEAKE